MRINRYLFLVICILFTTSQIAFSLEVVGQIVRKKDYVPISSARIEGKRSNITIVSDENGYFRFITPEESDTLTASALGYASTTIPCLRSRDSLVIELELAPIKIPGLTVRAKSLSTIGYYMHNLDVVEVKDRNITELRDELNKFSNIIIQKNAGGESRLTINGSDPRQVSILIDGIPVNSFEGSFDIEQIPLELVERIEIIPNNASAIAGDRAIGGIINLVLHNPSQSSKNSISLSTGSWNLYKASVFSNLPVKAHNILLSFNITKADNDFEYFNEYENRTVSRENNDVFVRSVMLKISSLLTSNLTNDISFLWQVTEKGVPGQTTDYMWHTNARACVQRYYIRQELSWSSSNLKVSWKNAYQKETSHYKNLDTNIFYQYNSENLGSYLESSASVEFSKHGIEGEVATGYREESYRFDNLLETSVEQSIPQKYRGYYFLTCASRLPLKSRVGILTFAPHFRSDYILHENWFFSAKLGAEFSPAFAPNLLFTTSYGNGYRMPFFSSLYWQGDSRVKGNPELEPELSQGFDWSIEWSPEPCNIRLTGFSNRVRDLIYWYKSEMGIWKPDNLAEAKITGITGDLHLQLTEWLSFVLSATWFQPLNKTQGSDHYNNYLPYSPIYKTAAQIQVETPKFYFSTQVQQIGRQFDNLANTVKLEPYKTIDVQCGIPYEIGTDFLLNISLGVWNLLDTQYELYRHIPVPGRQFEFKLQLQIQ
jgi:outer membrane cobalamin receptor